MSLAVEGERVGLVIVSDWSPPGTTGPTGAFLVVREPVASTGSTAVGLGSFSLPGGVPRAVVGVHGGVWAWNGSQHRP